MQTLDRRSFLGSAAATALAVGAPALAAPGRPFFERIGKPIGFQLYVLGDEVKNDLDAAFAQVAAIGYRDIELPNLYGRDPATVRAAAARAGLTVSSLHMHVFPAPAGKSGPLSLVSEPSRIAEAMGELGARHIVLPLMLFPEKMQTKPGLSMKETIVDVARTGGDTIWKRTAAFLNEKGAMLKPHGITLGYHNHNLEFAPIGKTSGWEILVRETDPSLVGFEVDVGWVAAAGIDPVRFLKTLRGRVSTLHVKDLKASSKPNFAIDMDPAEVGAGKLDWARILPAAEVAGARHYYVEQEPPFAIPRIEAARRSYQYLKALKA